MDVRSILQEDFTNMNEYRKLSTKIYKTNDWSNLFAEFDKFNECWNLVSEVFKKVTEVNYNQNW